MIQAKDVLTEAYGSLRHNRRRTAITMLRYGLGNRHGCAVAGLWDRLFERDRRHLQVVREHAVDGNCGRTHVNAGWRQ